MFPVPLFLIVAVNVTVSPSLMLVGVHAKAGDSVFAGDHWLNRFQVPLGAVASLSRGLGVELALEQPLEKMHVVAFVAHRRFHSSSLAGILSQTKFDPTGFAADPCPSSASEVLLR